MSQDYRVLAAFVHRVQGALYRRRLLQGSVVLLTVLLTLLLLGVGIQQLIPLLPIVAPMYSLLALLIVLALGLYVLWPALRPVSQRQALTGIETTYPELHDDLSNALQLDPEALARHNPHGMALELVHALHHHTVRLVTQYKVRTVVGQHRLFGLSWGAMILLATGLVSVLQPGALPGVWHVLTRPFSYLPPRQMRITVTPEHAIIAAGTNLEIQAQVSGRLPRNMQLRIQDSGETAKTYAMEALEPGVFRYTFLKPQTSLTFYALANGFTSPQGTLEVVPAPATGQVALRYLFPDYTGLPERSQEGGGDIQALPGTRVQLQMRANVLVRKGVLRFETGQELPLTISGQTLRGELLVMQPGAYTIDIEDTHGLKNLQPPRYTVQVQPDHVPTVNVLEPQDGLEVDETTALQVQYQAEDDFGLQNASLVYFAPGGTEKRIPLHQGRFDHRQAQETFTWDMHQWPLPDSDTVQMYIEVYDNDTISGPKKGVSATLTLNVRSRAQEHDNLERLQEEVADAVLDLLGDHLELSSQLQAWQEQAAAGQPPPDAEALAQAQERQQQGMQRAEEIAQHIEEALAKIQNDPYSTYEAFADMQAMQRNMSYLQNTLMSPLQQHMQGLTPSDISPEQLAQSAQQLEAVLQELERLSSLSEHIANSEKMGDLMRLSNKMMQEQNALLTAMDNLPKDFQGGELPPDLQRLLDTLHNMMQDLMQAAAQLPTAMSDAFMNQKLDTLPLTDMQRKLQELQEKLMAGDVAGARELASELLKALSSMVAAMQNMQQQARGGAMDALGQQLQESSDRMADLVQRQEHILDGTQQIDQETIRALNEAQQRAFDLAQQRLDQELNKLSRRAWELLHQAQQQPRTDPALEEIYKQLLTELNSAQRHLRDRDVPQVKADLEEVARQLAWMQHQASRVQPADPTLQHQATRVWQHLQAARRALDSLPQDRQAMLTPAQKGQLGGLGEQQAGVQTDTQALQQQFEQLLPLMPFLPPEIRSNLEAALPFMGQAQSELESQHSQPAIPPEQAALERLRNAQNTMQQALQSMAQRGQMMGMSVPMLRQAGRFPMPGMMPQPDVGEQQAGAAGASVRNFQLPDKEAYKVPRMFREDIVEALREGYPQRYKELIEQYYRDIVR